MHPDFCDENRLTFVGTGKIQNKKLRQIASKFFSDSQDILPAS